MRALVDAVDPGQGDRARPVGGVGVPAEADDRIGRGGRGGADHHQGRDEGAAGRHGVEGGLGGRLVEIDPGDRGQAQEPHVERRRGGRAVCPQHRAVVVEGKLGHGPGPVRVEELPVAGRDGGERSASASALPVYS